jgi:FdhD protein
MGRKRLQRLIVTRVANDRISRRPDHLIVEEPMTIRLDGTVVATTMRTPGHDFELAAGFCFTEGHLSSERVQVVRYCAIGSAVDTEFNVVSVETVGGSTTAAARIGPVSSSCGWCGSGMIDEYCAHLEPLPMTSPIAIEVISGVVEKMGDHQGLFAQTGAVHAAAAFDPEGALEVVREDVGRHNAVDKVVGSLLLGQQLPATGRGLFISGRASVEMVHKAWAAGFGTLVAVSAPTALAVETARRAGLWLVGFVRGREMNIYAPDNPRFD